MSLGYAEKLSYIEDVGKVGMSEIFDPLHVLQEKVKNFLSHSLVFSHIFLPIPLLCLVLCLRVGESVVQLFAVRPSLFCCTVLSCGI
ncbi:hypothetical protein CK203_011976 [Vitis vinifera]|uniref:Uncharacterized protein n=1 Tax=Vitis vinifera TaxID=29760 RepID=A0A438K0H2_VITVI|nr:hypothetical protein CK203_011976 [Vitis vinifera]